MQEKKSKTEMSDNSSKFEEYFSKFLKGKEEDLRKAEQSLQKNMSEYHECKSYEGILQLSRYIKDLRKAEQYLRKAEQSLQKNMSEYHECKSYEGIFRLSQYIEDLKFNNKYLLFNNLLFNNLTSDKLNYCIYNDLNKNGKIFCKNLIKARENLLKSINNDFIEKIRDILRKKYEEMELAEKNETKPADPHQKDFEMLIGIFLKDNLKNGTFKRPDRKDQLDFLFETKDGKKIRFECIAGNKNLEYSKPHPGDYTITEKSDFNNWFIDTHKNHHNRRLRYYSMISSKEDYLKKKIERGIISSDDLNILCVNSFLFEKNDLLQTVNFADTNNAIWPYRTYGNRKIHKDLTFLGKSYDTSSIGALFEILFTTKPHCATFEHDSHLEWLNEVQGGKFFLKSKRKQEEKKSDLKYELYCKEYESLEQHDIIFRCEDGCYEYEKYGNITYSNLVKIDDMTKEKVEGKGNTEEEKRKTRYYLPCNFFCRKDFPFNGILFTTVSIEWLLHPTNEFICVPFDNPAEQKTFAFKKFSLHYLQNPLKEDCTKYLEDICECIKCDIFYQTDKSN